MYDAVVFAIFAYLRGSDKLQLQRPI